MNSIESSNFARRFTHLLDLLSSPKFIAMEGLGNEIPYYICPFPANMTNQMYKDVEDLKKQLFSRQIRVVQISLYSLALDLLQKRGVLSRIMEMEPEWDKADLFEQLDSVLQTDKYIVPALEEYLKGSEYQILLVTGIGEVYPYIRTSTLLECMQSIKNKKPVVFFYPGEYDLANENGSVLRLFGVMTEKHYRAYNIFHCMPS